MCQKKTPNIQISESNVVGDKIASLAHLIGQKRGVGTRTSCTHIKFIISKEYIWSVPKHIWSIFLVEVCKYKWIQIVGHLKPLTLLS